jgi:hypothetical protein
VEYRYILTLPNKLLAPVLARANPVHGTGLSHDTRLFNGSQDPFPGGHIVCCSHHAC